MAGYKYRPDYKSLYPKEKMLPGESLTDEVLTVLRESDRKMEYLEYDIKTEQFRIDPRSGKAAFVPSREDSLDRLVELEVQFRADTLSVEDEALNAVLIEQMLRCLISLPESEQNLIRALFFEEKTEREYMEETRIPQQTINDRRRRILDKLRKMMNK